MSNSLKDAMIKAGIVKQDNLDREKEKERRDKIEKKGPGQFGIHAHHIRTDCAQCKKNSPDVEFYEHSNRSIEAKWLCIRCADKAWIKDDCRHTNQSSHAKAGKFRREFGATKRFPPPGSALTPQPANVGAGQPVKPAGAPLQNSATGQSLKPGAAHTSRPPATQNAGRPSGSPPGRSSGLKKNKTPGDQSFNRPIIKSGNKPK